MSDVVDIRQELRNIRHFYEEEWRPYREQSINALRELAEMLQSLENQYRKGSILYSILGFIGGGLSIGGLAAGPLTFGVSLILTLFGTILSLLSVIASLTHAGVNIGLTKKYCKEVKVVLDEDIRRTATLIEMLRQEAERDVVLTNLISNWDLFKGNVLKLKDPLVAASGVNKVVQCGQAINIFRLGGNLDEAAALVGLGRAIGPPIEGLVVAPRALAPLGVFGGFVAGISMVINIATIGYHIKQLKNNELCEHSQKLREEVEKMTQDLENFDRQMRQYLF